MTDTVGKAPPRPATLRSRVEWVALGASVAGAAALIYFNDDLSVRERVAGWALFGLALAYLLRAGWVRLFGPVLFYDLVRNARRSRTYVTRSGYLLLLLLVLWTTVGDRFHRSYGNGVPDPAAMAALAEGFFATFWGVQFGLAVLLTPAYVAGAITEEKERKTLEFLLATDLDNREIVLGKLVARLGYLTLLLLAGLPVLSAVQFLGGVDPDLVFAGFAATALIVCGLAGISILASVVLRRSRDAIMATYLVAGLYVALCLFGTYLVEVGAISRAPWFPGGPSPADCVWALQSGEPGHALSRLFTAGPAVPGATIRQNITPVLTAYAIFYGILTAVTVALAVARLRRVALRDAAGARKGPGPRARAGRQVSDSPMVWKEMHFSAGRSRRPVVLVLLTLLVLLSFVPVPFIFVEPTGLYHQSLAAHFNNYVRPVGCIVACMAGLAAAVRGSVAVRVERDKDTLDALLTSPLSTQEILYGKWVGCLWGLRWVGVWLGTVYLLGLVTGGLSPLAVPLLAGTVLVYCGTLAVVGLWCSVVCRTTVRATVAAVAATLGLSVGHWLIWLCCIPLGGPGGHPLDTLIELQAGITPPVVLSIFLPFGEDGQLFDSPGKQGEMIAYSLVGTAAWVVIGFVAWGLLNDRFQVLMNRADFLEPERRPPPRPLPEALAANQPGATREGITLDRPEAGPEGITLNRPDAAPEGIASEPPADK